MFWGPYVPKEYLFLWNPKDHNLGPTQLPVQWKPVNLSPEVKRPGLAADYSSPFSAEIKKWILTN
jgi:hypothetical protein